MTSDARPGSNFVFDTMCLGYFARIERLDVIRDIFTDNKCLTTRLVLAELEAAVGTYPALTSALDADWLDVVALDNLDEIKCFVKWARRIGQGNRDVGEASVLAAAELIGGIAITDDREAVEVGRKHGMVVHGTIWLLAIACRKGKLTEPGAGTLIDALRAEGSRLPCTGAEFFGYARQHGLL